MDADLINSTLTPFGKFVREMRIARGCYLKNMADFIGVSSAYLSGVEFGRNELTKEILQKTFEFFSSAPAVDLAKNTEWESLSSIGNRLHNLSVELNYASNEALSDELGQFAGLLWFWEKREQAPAVEAVPVAHVLMPRSAEEAQSMALLGMEWLKHNAPEKLIAPALDDDTRNQSEGNLEMVDIAEIIEQVRAIKTPKPFCLDQYIKNEVIERVIGILERYL